VANALGVAVQDGLAVHGRENIEPGDVIFSNHADTLGQHLNNVAMYTPIFAGPKDDELVGFMAIIVHWIDIGGMIVGSATASGTTDIYQEGVQYRSVKLWSRGKRNDDIYRIIEGNTRFPQAMRGDVESQLAGCLLGRDMVKAVVNKYGLQTVRAAIELMWQRSEASARAAIAAIPDGTYRASSFLDGESAEPGKPIQIDVAVHVKGDSMTVDLSGVSDQVKAPINSGREGGAVTAARIAFKYLVAPDEPANEGAFRPLEVVIPDGKFLSAKAPAPMGGYSTPLPSVIDTIVKCLVDVMPDRVAAGHHANFGMHGFAGIHPKTGKLYRCSGTLPGGWGAARNHDGTGPHKTMAHGDTLDVPVEMQEALYPIRIEAQRYRSDSGGAGEFRGGLGIEKVSTYLGAAQSTIYFDRRGCPPWGVLGGKAGAAPQLQVTRADGKVEEPDYKCLLPLASGDQIRFRSAGGGGYGDPLARDPDRVAHDVRMGFVSRESAHADYGVSLDEKGSVNAKLTAQERDRRPRGHP
jgi:N-methylhydantoinase B